MTMTIDEQIKIFESNSEFERKDGDLQGCLNFRQLAEWLKDYKRLLGAIEDIRAEIQTKYDSIPYRNNEYDDAWIDALDWVLESVFEKHISRKETE